VVLALPTSSLLHQRHGSFERARSEVAADHVVASDGPIIDRLVNLGVSESTALGRGNPRVEHLVTGPDREDDGLSLATRGLEHELRAYAVLFAHHFVLLDPLEKPRPLGARNADRS